ncbi:MAG: class I SAM-dependent methyltransferase [Hydrogenophilales bacterium]|nr:class I SAM-dependent methyltransferase [Hydrogenophilales bacterium]
MSATVSKKKHKQAGPVARLLRSLHEQGMRRTLQSALSIAEDWVFDWRHATDTVSRVYQVELDFEHPNKASAHPYIPTRGRAFRKLLSSLTFPQDSVFVDYGSGKGKVLLLASKLGFRRVVGIEYSPELHEVAVANIRRYGATDASLIEPVCCDATEYVLRDDENAFYFFNPFELDVLQGVLRQIKDSLGRHRRKIWIIYFDPRFKEAFEKGLGAWQTQMFTYGGYEVVVLEN